MCQNAEQEIAKQIQHIFPETVDAKPSQNPRGMAQYGEGKLPGDHMSPLWETFHRTCCL